MSTPTPVSVRLLAARLLLAGLVDVLRAAESGLRNLAESDKVAGAVPCSVCGGRIPNPRHRWSTRLVICLVDQNRPHHASCRDGCDMCVAAVRIGVRP